MWISSCQWYRFPTAALSASGIRVEGDSFLSACPNKLPCIFSCKIKTGETFCGFSCKKSVHDDFLRRHYPHQVKGRSWMTSSQPAHTSSPVFISFLLYTFPSEISSRIYQRNRKNMAGIKSRVADRMIVAMMLPDFLEIRETTCAMRIAIPTAIAA